MRNLLLILIVATTCHNTYGQDPSIKKWSKGAYYDLKGERHKGFISVQKSTPGTIWFKTESESGMNKLPAAKIKGFIAGADSFVVSCAPYLQLYPFLRVVINGTLKMYVSKQVMASAPAKSTPQYQYNTDLYYYGSNPDNLTEIKSANFLDAMDKILVSKPDLLKKIKLKQYTFNDMEEIVTEYNGTKPGNLIEKPKAN